MTSFSMFKLDPYKLCQFKKIPPTTIEVLQIHDLAKLCKNVRMQPGSVFIKKLK